MTKSDRDLVLEPSSAVELARTFVDLARSVNDGADLVYVYSMLSDRCVQLLPIEACGVLLIDLRGHLRVIGSSSHAAELLDLFQVQNDEGPCLKCCRSGESVADVALEPEGEWPRFSALARGHGFGAVYAIPLRSRDVVLGALNLFASTAIDEERLGVARSLADAATIALLQADPGEDVSTMTRRVHLAVETRATVDQATGIVAQRFELSVDDALARLRTAADDANSRLVDVASAVVARDGNEPESLRAPAVD